MKSRFVPGLLACALAAATARAREETAVKVYRDVQGCVVALENLEGGGTGIILDRDGLILTNAHVVASPLPFKCKVDLLRGKKSEPVTFKRVKILGVHPKQDLALVRIDPSKHKGKLQVAKIAPRKAIPGQWVCAIGNPAGGGVVLSKTITTGVLSGVDRVINGVSYYQISAAINPGNSGGPLCDKSGFVIGLVTLKLSDVENVGFAIPLHGLKPAEFVPLAKRKGDPARTGEYLALAEKYFKMSQAIRKRNGAEDVRARLYELFSAQCYHMALANDPGNAALYYNVGMLLRGLDSDEIAAAYLLQAVELKPWDDNTRYYHELGFALVKQKKGKEAQIAWEEGVAKYPVKAAKVWEDLIIFYRNEQQDFHKSAYAAAVVMHLANPDARIDMAKQLHREARQFLDDKGKKKLDAAVAKIKGDLKLLEAKADKARQAGKPYVTEAFAAYVKNSGTLGQQDEATSVAKIGPDSASGSPVVTPAVPRRPKLDLTVPAGSYDLLRDVNPDEDAVRGTWRFADKVLVTPPSAHARIQFPTKLPAEYDLTMIVERKSNLKEFVIGLVRDGVQSAFLIDVDGNTSGIDPGGRGVHRGRVFTNNQPATIKCMIRHEGLLVSVDGKRIFFQRTGNPFPPAPAEWKVPDPARLFIGSHMSKYYVHKLMLTPYTQRK